MSWKPNANDFRNGFRRHGNLRWSYSWWAHISRGGEPVCNQRVWGHENNSEWIERERFGALRLFLSGNTERSRMLILSPCNFTTARFLKKEAVLSPCNFATARLTACILNFHIPLTFRPMKRRTLSQHQPKGNNYNANRRLMQHLHCACLVALLCTTVENRDLRRLGLSDSYFWKV